MENVTGIILAGGKSSRMGTDKGLMDLNGMAMIEHVLNASNPVCTQITIVTNNPAYTVFGYELIEDEQLNYGPVIGILSGLRQSKTDKNLVLSCDVPYVTSELLIGLIQSSNNINAVVAKSANGMHPLIGVYNKNCIPIFEQAVKNKEHRLQSVLQQLTVQEMQVTDENQLRNLNTKQDLIS